MGVVMEKPNLCPSCLKEWDSEDEWLGVACELCGGNKFCEEECPCEKAREEYFKENPWNQE